MILITSNFKLNNNDSCNVKYINVLEDWIVITVLVNIN